MPESSLHITLTFPYGSHKKTGADFHAPSRHKTIRAGASARNIILDRVMDTTRYRVTAGFTGAELLAEPDLSFEHRIRFSLRAKTAELFFRFEPLGIPGMDINRGAAEPVPPSFDEARVQCAGFWKDYWNSGGTIDLSDSSDRRAGELERRIVLSRYLTAIQSRGILPPAETGLSCNSWYGKFHLEMFYWHSAFFALWGQAGELKKTLAYYRKLLPAARNIAAAQGYRGARWPKMCDPTGYNTPSSVAVLLIWQQPHPVMLAELCYRAAPDKTFLREYRDVVVETAEFMADFIHRDEGAGERYVLGPPYIPAQERHDPRIVLNASYELEYFRWGFRQADIWLTRLGEAPRFGTFAEKLAPPPRGNGRYLAHEHCPAPFPRRPFYTDHPSMLAMYGILRSEKTEPAIMSATLDQVLETWDMRTFYGWDFPMMAMTACRLGRVDDAINILLMDSPKNTYLSNGHNRQTGDDALPLYLPGNGGLLIAAAMLAAGYGDPADRNQNRAGPLFPAGFTVKTEGLHAYI